MVSVLIILGAMLAGAAALAALVYVVHVLIGVVVFESAAVGWLVLPALLVAPFLGAGIGLTAGLAYFGLVTLARMIAVLLGIAFLGISFRVAMPLFAPTEGWPVLYTFRQGLRVIAWCAPTIIAGSFCYMPLPCLASVALITWGIIYH